jgi:hypothetical protein
MLRFLACLTVLGGFVCAMSTMAAAQDKKDDTFIKVEIKGKLKTGLMAIGGETTGIIIAAKDGSMELDFGKNEKLRELANANDGKTVTAKGTLTMRRGVEIKGVRMIVNVTDLTPEK